MNAKLTDNTFSPSQTKGEKLQELCALLDELYALKEKKEGYVSASDPEKINFTSTGGEKR